ncbi:MAG: HigA family addiction module antidote protein [Anaerolineales bacterium]|nr:HigA family addiction module antidote protein [Anaerolineales bacterium]
MDKINPFHPGEVILEEFLKPWGMSRNQLAQHMGITATRLNDIVLGRRGITGDTALRLARATNTTPELWINYQALYDLDVATDKLGDWLLVEVTPVKETVVG